MEPSICVLTDLWPSASEPYAGTFVRAQVAALAPHYRQVVLVPRLVMPRIHVRIWGAAVQGRQEAWAEPAPPARLLRYPIARLPKAGEAGARAIGAVGTLVTSHERPSLIHGHFLHEVGVAAVRLARVLRIPSIVTVHGTDARWVVRGGVQERHRRSMLAAARSSDRVIVVERHLAEQLSAAGVPADRLAVVPMGVDPDIFCPQPRELARERLGLRPDRRLVLFLGRATREKGVDLLDDAVAGIDADCVAVGPRGIAEHIRFVGKRQAAEVADWLAAADVLCLPSRAEGMPVSIMEALASGRPVVATSVGGIPEQVVDGATGFVVPPDDAASLREALRAALDRDWDEVRIRHSSERFWWSRVGPEIAAIYEQLL